MKRETVKALLANGILQAYAEGKIILYRDSEWDDYTFDGDPEEYRIKPTPQFKVGDLVRGEDKSVGVITVLTTSLEAYVELFGRNGLKHIYRLCELTPVREVSTPLTFEQAVKLVAEKGVRLHKDGVTVTLTAIGVNGVDYKRYEPGSDNFRIWGNMASYQFPDGTPFANVTYEDIT